MPTLLMINLKGGVGKTASTIAVAETMAEKGYRTLVIDADHQSMSGELLLGQTKMIACENARKTLHDVFLLMADIDFEISRLQEFVIPSLSSVQRARPQLSVIPCSFRIDDFFSNVFRSRRTCRTFVTERELSAHLRKQMPKVKRMLERSFDFVLVDCPPSITMQVKMFLKIADAHIIPSVPDQLSVRGSENLVRRLRNFRTHGLGTLWTLYRRQAAIHREIVACPFAGLPEPFETVIPNASRLADAAAPHDANDIFFDCNAKYGREFAERYRALLGEIECRCEQSEMLNLAETCGA